MKISSLTSQLARLALWPVWDSNYKTHKNHNTNIQTMSQLNCMHWIMKSQCEWIKTQFSIQTNKSNGTHITFNLLEAHKQIKGCENFTEQFANHQKICFEIWLNKLKFLISKHNREHTWQDFSRRGWCQVSTVTYS